MCFAKHFLSLFLNQEKLLVVLAKRFKNLSERVNFQRFYLDFKLLLLQHFRFPIAHIF